MQMVVFVTSSNISSMRRSVSLLDERLRRELKMQCAAEYF